jgi:hypothetical protein
MSTYGIPLLHISAYREKEPHLPSDHAQGHVAATVDEAEHAYVNTLGKGDVVIKAQVCKEVQNRACV